MFILYLFYFISSLSFNVTFAHVNSLVQLVILIVYYYFHWKQFQFNLI